jgi:ATP-dependent Clp protease ATP-binding subunit ClpA
MLLGAPPGYIGYSDGGLLVDALTSDGRAVVLFDEIEKAHPQVLQVLMNLMDAGRLSHPRGGGEPIDARSALLCFTSNAGADALSKKISADDDSADVDGRVRSALVASNFLPEFVGRLSACLHFRPLSDEAVIEIAALSVARVADEYGLNIGYIEPTVVQQVVDLADAGRFGARMIEYAVERLLAPLFAKHAGREHESLRLLGGPLRLIERAAEQ